MSAVVVVGAQWGDEGKGKIVDLFTERAKLVVRYAGGPNAGHTLVVGDEKVIVRLIPSGILRAETRCVLAQGMVIDPDRLLGEIDELIAKKKLDEKTLGTRLTVSDRAHAILPYHVAIDSLREKGDGAIGTTKRGVGPCYEDKAARRGIPLGAFRDLAKTEKLARFAIEAWSPVAKALGGELPSIDDVMTTVKAARARLLPLLADTSALVNASLAKKEDVLFGRRARNAARFGSRHVSVRDVVDADIRRRLHRLGRWPHAHRSRDRFGEGVHHARWRRSISDRAA